MRIYTLDDNEYTTTELQRLITAKINFMTRGDKTTIGEIKRLS